MSSAYFEVFSPDAPTTSKAVQKRYDEASALLKGKRRAVDQESNALEQLVMSALALGKIQEAKMAIEKLTERFPDSPRVDVLHGMELEASGRQHDAVVVYQNILASDETNIPANRRLLSLPSLSTSDRIGMLLEYLDTFYTDVEGWNLLGELYMSLGLHSQAVAALSHTLLIEAQSPLRFLNHAEAAYAAGDLPLAFKSYMLCLNISEKPGNGEEDISLKAWYGVKLVTRTLLSAGGSASSASGVAVPTTALLQEFDVLATKWLAKISAMPSQELDAELLKAVREGALAGESGAK